MFKKLVKDKSVKVILLEIFLIVLGVVGLTLGVKYIMNSIGINVGTSTLAIDEMNATVSSGNLSPVADSSINVNTTSNVLRITFDVKGASTNTGDNIIYDAILNIDADCALKNENIKWNLYKNSTLLTSGTTSPKYDKDVLNGKITLTDTQQDLAPYSGTADKYVFILWMSDNCTESDITKCDLNSGLNSDMSNKTVTGNIDIRLNSGKKKVNNRETANITNVCTSYATYVVEHLDDGTTGDSSSGVYAVHHDAIASGDSASGNDIPPVTDYRYYGADPNNYICLDMEGQSTCPDRGLFRIIGSIYEENAGKNLIKVIKATPLTDGTTSTFSWDYTSSGTYKNIWSSTTSGTSSGATLMQLLNGIYLTRGSGSYYNNSATVTTVNFSSTGLTDVAQSLMNTGKSNNGLSKYYLGGYSSLSLKTDAIYLAERGMTTSSGNALYWDGKVGLMYPSDYGYAAGNDCVTNTAPNRYSGGCRDKDWLYRSNSNEWTLTPYASDAYSVWCVNYGLASYGISYIPLGSRPTFYLKSDISITGGTGTEQDPYLVS